MARLTSAANDIVRAGRDIAKSQAMEVRIVGLVQNADDRLTLATRLAAHTDSGIATVKALGPHSVKDVAEADVAIIVVRDPTDPTVSERVDAVAARRRNTYVVALGSATEALDRVAAEIGVRASMVVCSPHGDVIPDELADRVVKAMAERKYALAAAFPVFRPAAVASVISATSWQNAAVATFLGVPGADMPVLTANQIKMVLEIAAVYGETIGFERAKEILAVVAGGFTLRTIAREALGFVPGPGWLLKGGIAYSGTVAIGKAAERYFALGPDGRAGLASRLRRRLPQKT